MTTKYGLLAILSILCIVYLSMPCYARLDRVDTHTLVHVAGKASTTASIATASFTAAPIVYNGTTYSAEMGICGSCGVGAIVMTDYEGEPPVVCASDNVFDLTSAWTDGWWEQKTDIYVYALDLSEAMEFPGLVITMYSGDPDFVDATWLPMVGISAAYKAKAFEWNNTTNSYDAVALTDGATYVTDTNAIDGDCSTTLAAPVITTTVTFAPVWDISEDGTADFVVTNTTTLTATTATIGVLPGEAIGAMGTGTLTVGNAIGIGTEVESTLGGNQIVVKVNKTYTDFDENTFVAPGGEGTENYYRSGLDFNIVGYPLNAFDGSGNYQVLYGIKGTVMTAGSNNMSQVLGGLFQVYAFGPDQEISQVTGLLSQIGVVGSGTHVDYGRGINVGLVGNAGTWDELVGIKFDNLGGGGTVNDLLIGIDIPAFSGSLDATYGFRVGQKSLFKDDTNLIFGNDEDWKIKYDAAGSSTLLVQDGTGNTMQHGRGTGDTDVTYLTLYNADGELCYVYPNTTQDGWVVSSDAP